MLGQCRERQGREGQDGEGQGREGQGREGEGREGQGREGKGRAGKGRTGQGRTGKGREGQGREGQDREGQGRKAQDRTGKERDTGPRPQLAGSDSLAYPYFSQSPYLPIQDIEGHIWGPSTCPSVGDAGARIGQMDIWTYGHNLLLGGLKLLQCKFVKGLLLCSINV